MKTCRNPQNDLEHAKHEPYLAVFLLGFIVMAVTILPILLVSGGYLTYYGDFNSQQLPFYWHAHEMVQNLSFGWDWQTDLGANFIGSYTFYLLGSPFFWLTALLPQRLVLFAVPFLLALKSAVAALTSYAFLRRFVRSRRACIIGGLLYAYSGFQIFNVFFNHFHDVTAFFPLLLIAMEARINENRRAVFALTITFTALINYYFFAGEAVFAVIYFLVRCPSPDFRVNWRKFFSLIWEGILGVCMAAVLLLPSALAVIENSRVDSFLTGLDMVAYPDRTRYLHILQSFFMFPDVPARPNLFQTDYAKWASIGGYLPMFSMAGVIAFMTQKRRHWATRLVGVCIVFACIPVLNASFHLFNSTYYARWYYMPVLIMALMTAYALDNPAIKWGKGFAVCAAVLGACAVISFFPSKNDEGKLVWLEFAKYPWYVWLTVILCGAMLFGAAKLIRSRRRSLYYLRFGIYLTAFSCLVTSCAMMYFGIALGADPVIYKQDTIETTDELHLPGEDDQFFRIDVSDNVDNYPMFWGYPNMRCFHSVVPASIMEFYSALEITRDVASRAELKDYPLRGLFNVKYYFDRKPDKYDEKFEEPYSYKIDLPGFSFYDETERYYIYINEAYVPMGVAYDTYIPMEELDKCMPLVKEKTMLKAVGLNEDQVAKYGDMLTEISDAEKYLMDEGEYIDFCLDCTDDACDTFTYDSYGFRATITLDQPKLVFFSVPYESGWTAEVNGAPAEAERVSYGFMAVFCDAGENEIRFHYRTPGLRVGLMISAAAVIAFGLYLLAVSVTNAKRRSPHPAYKHDYDYPESIPFPQHELYLHYAKQRYRFASTEEDDQKG
ncbi:MAG: YfhO family protein [Oscillospiraceae bacterium]|nr:YfhO family protein [Oscillospiraceae bacterium]